MARELSGVFYLSPLGRGAAETLAPGYVEMAPLDKALGLVMGLCFRATRAVRALLKWYMSWQEDQVLPVPGPATMRHLTIKAA